MCKNPLGFAVSPLKRGENSKRLLPLCKVGGKSESFAPLQRGCHEVTGDLIYIQ